MHAAPMAKAIGTLRKISVEQRDEKQCGHHWPVSGFIEVQQAANKLFECHQSHEYAADERAAVLPRHRYLQTGRDGVAGFFP